MSLLLDALKRAEQEKLSRQGERGADARAPERAAAGASAASLELQPLGEARAAAPARGGAANAARTEAEAANMVFQAKAGQQAKGSKAGLIWGISIAIAVVVLGAGGYVWYMMESLKPRMTPAARVAKPLAMALPDAAAPAPPVLDAPPAAATLAQAPAAESSAPSTTAAAVPAAPKGANGTDPMLASLLQEARSPAAARPSLKLERSAERPAVPPAVAQGYRELLEGNLLAARRSYLAALATESASVDAELGLATVEARLGQRDEAALHYRRALDLDPRNGTALAALAALAEDAQPASIEATLQAAVVRAPDSAALHLALGNAYAAQSRWPEAQAEYYEAHRLAPADADIAYNLAVSLDHLGQGRAAAGFYARALAAARDKGAQFDPASVTRRLSELK